MNNIKSYIWVAGCLLVLMLGGCDANTIVDNNLAMPSRNWSYANKVKAVVEIADPSKRYQVDFKLRHTADYKYSNIFVLLHLKAAGRKKETRRFEFKLAEPDGKWTGSGSGNLYTYTFSMLKNYQFPAAGHYELEVEQNMRNNPLKEISDAGIKVSKQGE